MKGRGIRKGGTLYTKGQMISRRIYEAVRGRHVRILRALIILCCFAALGVVLFGRDIGAIALAIAVGSAWLLMSKIWH